MYPYTCSFICHCHDCTGPLSVDHFGWNLTLCSSFLDVVLLIQVLEVMVCLLCCLLDLYETEGVNLTSSTRIIYRVSSAAMSGFT